MLCPETKPFFRRGLGYGNLRPKTSEPTNFPTVIFLEKLLFAIDRPIIYLQLLKLLLKLMSIFIYLQEKMIRTMMFVFVVLLGISVALTIILLIVLK